MGASTVGSAPFMADSGNGGVGGMAGRFVPSQGQRDAAFNRVEGISTNRAEQLGSRIGTEIGKAAVRAITGEGRPGPTPGPATRVHAPQQAVAAGVSTDPLTVAAGAGWMYDRRRRRRSAMVAALPDRVEGPVRAAGEYYASDMGQFRRAQLRRAGRDAERLAGFGADVAETSIGLGHGAVSVGRSAAGVGFGAIDLYNNARDATFYGRMKRRTSRAFAAITNAPQQFAARMFGIPVNPEKQLALLKQGTNLAFGAADTALSVAGLGVRGARAGGRFVARGVRGVQGVMGRDPIAHPAQSRYGLVSPGLAPPATATATSGGGGSAVFGGGNIEALLADQLNVLQDIAGLLSPRGDGQYRPFNNLRSAGNAAAGVPPGVGQGRGQQGILGGLTMSDILTILLVGAGAQAGRAVGGYASKQVFSRVNRWRKRRRGKDTSTPGERTVRVNEVIQQNTERTAQATEELVDLFDEYLYGEKKGAATRSDETGGDGGGLGGDILSFLGLRSVLGGLGGLGLGGLGTVLGVGGLGAGIYSVLPEWMQRGAGPIGAIGGIGDAWGDVQDAWGNVQNIDWGGVFGEASGAAGGIIDTLKNGIAPIAGMDFFSKGIENLQNVDLSGIQSGLNDLQLPEWAEPAWLKEARRMEANRYNNEQLRDTLPDWMFGTDQTPTTPSGGDSYLAQQAREQERLNRERNNRLTEGVADDAGLYRIVENQQNQVNVQADIDIVVEHKDEIVGRQNAQRTGRDITDEVMSELERKLRSDSFF